MVSAVKGRDAKSVIITSDERRVRQRTMAILNSEVKDVHKVGRVVEGAVSQIKGNFDVDDVRALLRESSTKMTLRMSKDLMAIRRMCRKPGYRLQLSNGTQLFNANEVVRAFERARGHTEAKATGSRSLRK